MQRNFERTSFSSQGPVRWNTEHYQQGLVDKPDFCAINSGLPRQMPDGTVRLTGANGNSFAGPMLAGTLSLMMSADQDLLVWDARKILVETASDVGPKKGFDHQTGHGLLNCYHAVREVLRRKALREGSATKPFEGFEASDRLDIESLKSHLKPEICYVITNVNKDSVAEAAGFKTGDILEDLNSKPTRTRKEFEVAFREARSKDEKSWFKVGRHGKSLELEVQVPKQGKFGIRSQEVTIFDEPVFRVLQK